MTSETPTKKTSTLAWICLFITVAGCIIALLFPPVVSRGPGRRAVCLNNLKNISLALLNYENNTHSFPAGGETNKDGRPARSWRVMLLPYLDRRDLFEAYDSKEAWNSPKNREIAKDMPSYYRCPSDADNNGQQTSYVMPVGPKTVGGLDDKDRNLEFINSHSGSSTTLLLIEVPNSGINWMEPRDLTIDEIIERLKNHKMDAHGGVFNVAFCDGHIQRLPVDIDPEELRALADPNRDKSVDMDKL